MPSYTISLSDELAARLEREAELSRLKAADLLRDAAVVYLEQRQRVRASQEQAEARLAEELDSEISLASVEEAPPERGAGFPEEPALKDQPWPEEKRWGK